MHEARSGVGARTLGLTTLLDFLLGLSIDEVSVRYRLSREKTEDELRNVLLNYGFDAKGMKR
jgi:hypothetical protein